MNAASGHSPPTTGGRAHRWVIFGLATTGQFMVVLDASIMNVALASVQRSLHFSQVDLPWVLNIYILMFGGFLLLGGRAGDLFGRRRLFIGGLLLFSLSSLAGGLAQNPGWLVAARGAQGLGAAIIAPLALAIVSDTFVEGRDRNRALGIYGSLAGVGGACGVLLGGILTSSFGWQWVLFVNVPLGLTAAALSPFFIARSDASERSGDFDPAGAVSMTAALMVLVFGIVKAPEASWTSVQTLGSLASAVVLSAAFLIIEQRSSAPLVRLGIFRIARLRVANTVALLVGAAMASLFYFLSLYLQLVLHYSALTTGFAYLPMALMIMLSAAVAGPSVTRFGLKAALVAGLGMAALGLSLLTRLGVGAVYPIDVLPATLIFAAGLGFTLVPLTIAALVGVDRTETGLVSGLINASRQVGGALGLAILSTISTSRFNDLIHSGPSASFRSALVSSYHAAFVAGAILLALGAILVFALLPNSPRPSTTAEAESSAA